jgi:hypothetical protein
VYFSPRTPSLAALIVLALALVAFERPATADSHSGPYQIAAAENVNLDSLRSSLRETDAIGFVTKLSLKHQLDSLLESFGDYHRGQGDQTLPSLHQQFAELLDSTLSVLRDEDPQLYRTEPPRVSRRRFGLSHATMASPLDCA